MKMRPSAFQVLLGFAGLFALVSVFSYITGNFVITLEWNHQNRNLDTREAALNSTNNNAVINASSCTSTAYDFKGAYQEDPRLIEYIRRELLIPPSVHSYKLANPKGVHFSQFNQSKIVNEMLNGMKDGFFVEVGAADGESLSNSIFFEKELGWRGLLIEATPGYFKVLQTKNRKAYSIHAALALSTYASEVIFNPNLGYGSKLDNQGVKVKGIPFFSILRALDVKIVDFLSLDIESFEVKVLKTIPWDKIKFRLMCIEVAHIPEGKEFLTKFLQEKGYKFLGYGYLDIDAWYALPELLNTSVKPW
ncbi:protein Star-like [Macrobrachium rosenbergii]|uniref:protein Star-like n=1 Tax=Macrobrachium rosenbergii TaxID=79674 RepID=UPI0034D56A59